MQDARREWEAEWWRCAEGAWDEPDAEDEGKSEGGKNNNKSDGKSKEKEKRKRAFTGAFTPGSLDGVWEGLFTVSILILTMIFCLHSAHICIYAYVSGTYPYS